MKIEVPEERMTERFLSLSVLGNMLRFLAKGTSKILIHCQAFCYHNYNYYGAIFFLTTCLNVWIFGAINFRSNCFLKICT